MQQFCSIVMVPDWSVDIASFSDVPDWSRGCIHGVQGVVKPQTGFKEPTRTVLRWSHG